MAICPKCKADIVCLNHYQSGEMKYDFQVIDGECFYEEMGFQGNDGTCDWECPQCSEVIFTDEQKAVKFLSNKTKKITSVGCKKKASGTTAKHRQKNKKVK